MDQSTQTNGTTYHVKVAGPFFDRELGRWRLRLLTTEGEEMVTELDRNGRALNQLFGRQAVVKGMKNVLPSGENLFVLQSFDIPRSRSTSGRDSEGLEPEEDWESDEPSDEDDLDEDINDLDDELISS